MSDLPLTTRVCDDTITKLEHQRDKALSDADFWSNAHDKLEAEVAEVERIRLQDQAKITELQLQLEKEKEATRNALADRDQVSKQLTKVREANEQLAKNCEENDALNANINKLLAICDDIDTAGDMFKPEITGYFKYVNQKCKEAQQLRGGGLDEAV